MFGPVKLFAPGFERQTRNRRMEYEGYLLVIGCAVSGAINCQVLEKKDPSAVLDGLNRFFSECSVPKIMYPDKDGALVKAISEGCINLIDLQGRLHSERGLQFEVCLPQNHSAHGRIERRIRMIQQSLARSELRNSRCTSTGWQTIAKLIEREVNSVPLGYLHHHGAANPLMKILCPALLKNGTYSDRSPKGIFQIPDHVEAINQRTMKLYDMWFRVWNTTYIPYYIKADPKSNIAGQIFYDI